VTKAVLICYNISVITDKEKQMPYNYDLEKFKEQAITDAISIFPGGRSRVDWMVQAIAEKIVAGYVAGYKQCNEDIKIGA